MMPIPVPVPGFVRDPDRYDEGFAQGRIAGLKEAAEIARAHYESGKSPYAIALAIESRMAREGK